MFDKELKEKMLSQIGHKAELGDKCMCFNCSMEHMLHSDDILEAERVKVVLQAIGATLNQKVDMMKQLDNPVYLAGNVHGILVAMSGFGYPAYITKDVGLIKSTALHLMRNIAMSIPKSEVDSIIKKMRSS